MENGEWRMENVMAAVLEITVESCHCKKGEGRMENEGAILHSPFPILPSHFPILQFVIRKLFPATS